MIEFTTLTDGGQSPASVAREVADFVNEANQTLDLALYDVRVETGSASLVLAALLAAGPRGVAGRLR